MQALKQPFNMQQNCIAAKRESRLKVSLIVLCLIFNLSRLYPMIVCSIQHREREKGAQEKLKSCKRFFNNIMEPRGMCNDM